MIPKIVLLLTFIGKTIATFDFTSNFAFCDRRINLNAGQSRYLRSPYYPAGYMPGSSCRYQIQAPIDYQIQVTCNVDMMDPSPDGSCSSEKFYVAADGNKNISNASPICGQNQHFSRSSIGNVLTLAYTSQDYSGMFDCTLTAICDCGWGLKSRIVGGQQTQPNEFPSMAALISLTFEALYCGASIVSSRFVVTAAHCLRKTPSYESGVLVGDHNIDDRTDTAEARLYRALRFIEHPGYSNATDVNDVGLVQTIFPMIWSRGVGPVCLPFYYSGSDFGGVDVTATGYGTTEFGGPMSKYLQKVDLTVLENSDNSCKLTYPTIQDSQMCTYKEGKDTCQYDSGGPLYYSGQTGSRYFQLGLVSLGDGCAGSNPSLNTRMTSFMNWIERYTGTLCRRAIN